MKNLLSFFLILCCIIGCNKESEQLPMPDENGYIWLRDIKSLPLIKQTIRGKWKIHYTYGGLTGHQRVDLNNSYFHFLPNDSMYLIIESNTYAATKPDFLRKQTEFGFKSWILEFEIVNAWGLRDQLYPSFLLNDTLSLGQNSVDPISYRMTRIQ